VSDDALTPPPRTTLRGRAGSRAEDLAIAHLTRAGWTVLGRNVRVGRDEVDVIAIEPGRPATIVFVEVRSRVSDRFGAPEETIDGAKIARTYRGALALRRAGRLPDGSILPSLPARVDLVAVDLRPTSDTRPARVPRIRHVRAVQPD
jgi:putative endonuclease